MSDPTNPTYRAGEAYAITGPCSMASPCPGPDAPRDQHGAGCRWGVEAMETVDLVAALKASVMAAKKRREEAGR